MEMIRGDEFVRGESENKTEKLKERISIKIERSQNISILIEKYTRTHYENGHEVIGSLYKIEVIIDKNKVIDFTSEDYASFKSLKDFVLQKYL